jgi:hypothetical protein
MTHRRAWVPCTFFAALALVTLLVAGLRGGAIRAFALGVPSTRTVAAARFRHQVCEGPIRSQYAFRSVVLWGTYVSGKPRVRVFAQRPPAGASVSRGLVERSLPGAYGPFTAGLKSSVAGGRTVTVCVSDPDGEFKLQGSTAGYSGVSIIGSASQRAFSMVLMEPEQHSFIGSLGLAFSRASLFRPSWVGVWTFWALLIGLLLTVPLAAVAISAAISSEADDAG